MGVWYEEYGNYLYNEYTYWSLSPYSFSGNASIRAVAFGYGTGMDDVPVTWGDPEFEENGVRVVINLSPTVKITGDGSVSNPYKVI